MRVASDHVHGQTGSTVARTGVLRRVLAADRPLLSVTGPPGTGKTTLIAQWAERRGAAVAWVSCDRVHDDLWFLWTALIAALGMVDQPSMVPVGALTDDAARLGQHVAEMLAAASTPVTLVIDQVETLTSRETHALLGALAAALPPTARLALGSRDPVPFSLARMRVQDSVLELGAPDLAMTFPEASLLLRATGLELTDEATVRLVEETEGWPAALSLAARGFRSGDLSPERAVRGDDRLLSDYLRHEVLDRIPGRDADFLRRTSILAEVNGELGRAVGGRADAARLLEELHARHLLVEPLDSRGEWYRYHRLFRQMLQAELRRDTPDLVPELHARAAAWFEGAGELEPAIHHSELAGDADTFERLVLEAMQVVWAQGRVGVVEEWLEGLGRRSPSPHTPAMIVHGALIFAQLGRPGDAERWAAMAEGLPVGASPDGSTIGSTMAYLRANQCREGPAVMRRDAGESLAGLAPTSPYRPAMLHAQGLAALLEGDLDGAEACFAHAHDLAVSNGTSPLVALLLAELSLVAGQRGEGAGADRYAERALEVVAGAPLEDYWTSALCFAAAARAAARRGAFPEARQHLAGAERLRHLLTYALPVVSVQALLELAGTHLALLDAPGARDVLDQVHGILQQRPDLGTLVDATRQLEEQLDQLATVTTVGAGTLTPAELRLVPLLPTRMTMAQMGERLFVTRNTVKTHVRSLYQKLGASTRSEAVDRLTELGMLPGTDRALLSGVRGGR